MYFVVAGWAAAFSDARPGLPIGVGGSPRCMRVLYGSSALISETRIGRVQLFV
jgi:hypothetical protein